ncbi:hypothetical protein ACHAXT_010468 [Thalassiosira profunda]
MCKAPEASAAATRRRRRRRRPSPRERPPEATAAVVPPIKRAHLVTDEGFLRRLLANLGALAVLLAAGASSPRATDLFLDAYHAAKERMMDIAGEMAWWSLLSLLASSCCAVQLLLNALSLGCAGFNTVLGPLRPTFLALMIVAQLGSWCAAYYFSAYASGGNAQSWRMTAGSTVVSGMLTLLPEMLEWQTARRERGRRKYKQLQNGTEEDDGTLTNSVRTTMQLQLSTMGCSSCVSTVSRVLDGIDGVARHRVSLEKGIAEIVFEEGMPGGGAGAGASDLKRQIMEQLERAGFPAIACSGDT